MDLMAPVLQPHHSQIEKGLVVTLNRMGYMMTKPEALNQAFIDYAAKATAPVLEIGCAYGMASLQALKHGATVVANDLDPRHLAILKSEVPPQDQARLILAPGHVPNNLSFPNNSFSAVLASRVLNFIHPVQLQPTFRLIYHWLRPGGKFFFLVGSPYTGTYAAFLPQYQNNRKQGIFWPGYIADMKRYTNENRVNDLPKFVTLLNQQDVLALLKTAGFFIETLCYLAVDPRCLSTLKGDGREYVAAIGVKL